jgi:cytochrome c556
MKPCLRLLLTQLGTWPLDTVGRALGVFWMKSKFVTFAAIATTIAISITSVATIVSAASPTQKIAARQANFKVMGKSFKAIMDEMKKPTPDMALIKTSAGALQKASTHVADFFPKGTGPETGVKTHALPVIWERGADFRAAAGKLTAATAAMNSAAKSGDIAQVKAAFPGVGGSCKGCHDTFKGKD